MSVEEAARKKERKRVKINKKAAEGEERERSTNEEAARGDGKGEAIWEERGFERRGEAVRGGEREGERGGKGSQ